MPGVYGAAARKSEARQRSAGKGKRKAQLSAVDWADHVKRYRESGASRLYCHDTDMGCGGVVEDLPEVVNAEVGDAIEELAQLTLIPHVVAVQTDEACRRRWSHQRSPQR